MWLYKSVINNKFVFEKIVLAGVVFLFTQTVWKGKSLEVSVATE